MLQDLPVLAIDLETSGLDSKKDRILSIGTVAVDGLAIRCGTAWHVTVKTEELSSDIGAQFHGLGHDRIARGDEFAQVMTRFREKCADRVLLAHGGQVERRFLSSAFRQMGWPRFQPQLIDTLLLEQRRERALGPGQYRLDACRRRYHLPRYPAHNALTDALACAELFLAQCTYAGWRKLGSVLIS